MYQPKPDYQSFLALPACYSPTMSAADWQAEIDRMVQASQLTRDFVEGYISPDDHADGLADLGHDPNLLFELWENGVSFGGG